MADSTLFDSSRDSKEEWRRVPGYGEVYAASWLGRIKRLVGRGCKRERILRGYYDGRYVHLAVCTDGKPVGVWAHQLVAAAFHGPCPDGHEVNHKDLNGRNNRADNLEYLTHPDNVKHAINNGVRTGPEKGTPNIKNRKLADDQVRQIREIRPKLGLVATAKMFGVTHSHIAGICKGRYRASA